MGQQPYPRRWLAAAMQVDKLSASPSKAGHKFFRPLFPILAIVYRLPTRLVCTPSSYSDNERAGALACRTPCHRRTREPAATLGEGQRQGSAVDPKLWPATGLSNTGAHGGLQNLETASSLTS